jgi:S-adenosylmethionine:tRNA ribosyltransferase-isomerase
MRIQDFDFLLPEHLIAQHPTPNRTASRLLHLNGDTGDIADKHFVNIVNVLDAGDLIVLNDTRVIKARLFGVKATGGAVEVMIERVINAHCAYAHIKASRAPKPSSTLILADNIHATVTARHDDLFELQFAGETDVWSLLEQFGALPLPPYITHTPTEDDETRYQTVFAKHLGAVAAPTAGLHFDETTLEALKQKGVNIAFVTLHVGAGTFQPVRVEDITEHKMHSEIYHIPEDTAQLVTQTKQKGKKVLAVGTTALRALESAANNVNNAGQATLNTGDFETSIFITPGYQFKIVDRLLTNFHLPKSTLMMLVSAFGGTEHIKTAYAHAIQQEYRFFSYGDAMLIERAS